MLFSFIIWALFVFKFLLAVICSIFVYYKIINDQEYSGLREYICVTVSENVDELVERQRKKENDDTIYKTGLLESQTFDDFKEVENKIETSFNDTSYASNNNSMIELIERRPEYKSQDVCGPIPTMKKTETMESFVDNGNPQYTTRFSAILDSPYINSYESNDIKKAKIQSRSVNTPKYEDLSSSDIFNKIHSAGQLKSTTSMEFHGPLDSMPNTTNNIRNFNSNSSRPRPPPLQTKSSINSKADSNDNGRISTPMKAYFREPDLPRKGLLEDEDRTYNYT